MIYTFGEALAHVHSMLGEDDQVNLDNVRSAGQLAYGMLRDSQSWSKARQDLVLTTVAQVASSTTDTVTATLGSSTITSLETPFTAAMVGRQIQVGSEPQYLYVNAVTDSANIVLGDGNGTAVLWPRTTEAGASWRIFQSFYALPENTSLIISLAGDDPIYEYDGGRVALDESDPHRLETRDHADWWLYGGQNSSNVRTVELTPVPSIARIYRGQIATEAPLLDDQTVIEIDYSTFVLGILRLCTTTGVVKTGDEGWQLAHNNWSSAFKETRGTAISADRARISPTRTLNSRREARRRDSKYRATHLRWGR